MSSLLPISTYNLSLKPFQPSPAIENEYPVTVRITLAAVDPDAVDDKKEPSTLRLLKKSNLFLDDDISEDEDEDEDSEEDALDEESDSGSEEGEESTKPMSKTNKKQQKKQNEQSSSESDEADEEEEEEEDDDDDDDDVSEYVVCTLSPKVQYQQSIDLTISPDEEVYFVVTGSYPICLTGNYVEHPADEDSEDDYDYDYSGEDNLTPDEDEVLDEEEYDLDLLEDASDIENKIEELVEEDQKENEKKRSAENNTQASKKSKKSKKEDKNKKSVQFSDQLEQGPTGSTLVEKKETKKEKKNSKKESASSKESSKAVDEKKFPTKTLLGGVVTEDRKVGQGQAAKSGNKVGIRYIGKLKNGKVFDKNTSGKPFSFHLGKGECIKGFDLGVAGMAVGGERRVIIPAKMGYGSQALPGIPANSELTFDIKLVSLK